MPKLTINNQEIDVENGTSILQAAKQLGIEIPHFCYHDKLSVPANCRMCLVEIEGGPPKPAASCACLLYTSPSPRDQRGSRMPSSA